MLKTTAEIHEKLIVGLSEGWAMPNNAGAAYNIAFSKSLHLDMFKGYHFQILLVQWSDTRLL